MLERGDARREAAPLAPGPEAEIHRERDAGRGDVAERAAEPLGREAVEPVSVDRVAAVGTAVRAEDHEEVEVRARDELAPAELAHADDDRRDECPAGVAGHAVA